ncbi:MAG: hypothetical protein LBE35_09885 [Clostridiales bacterium]|jgi:S-DNA-T family DNA segregation ATPase FtsK/SpoIIIE|nr:hypothetical protein [Clostridiales bacterium]
MLQDELIDELRQLPAIVCVIDEFISLLKNIEDREEKETLTSDISALLRKGRHVKIHIVLASQEARKQDMEIVLNNVNARMAFSCSDFYCSRAILGEAGAEKLTGRGDMLFKSPESLKPVRLQGAYISDEEIEDLLVRLDRIDHDSRNKFVIPEFEMCSTSQEAPLFGIPTPVTKQPKLDSKRKKLAEVVLWTLGCDTVSILQIKTQFKMGNSANDIMEELHKMGLVSAKFANQPRNVIPKSVDDVPNEVMELLLSFGVSKDDIVSVMRQRDTESLGVAKDLDTETIAEETSAIQLLE